MWQPKPGDVVHRPRRQVRHRLKRVLGTAALFSIGYGDVGSSIYYGLGVVALVALGASPIVLGIAGIIYVFNALTYAEGSAMFPEGGGSASFARLGFNDVVGFASGWALMLSYVATMAISAYTIPPYLGYFWPVLKEPVAGTAFAMAVIAFLMALNLVGVKESARMNILFIVLDVITRISLIVAGVILIVIPKPEILVEHMFGPGNWPTMGNFIFGIALASLCFTGVESVSQLAEETRHPEKKIPSAYLLMVVAVLVLFSGISVVALATMTPQALGDPINGWARDPVAGIATGVAAALSPEEIAAGASSEPAVRIVIIWLLGLVRTGLPMLVALLAAAILTVATNAGLLGISRLTYHLASRQQLPSGLGRVHSSFRTPYIAILVFCAVTLLLLVPGLSSPSFFSDLGALYVFGSLLCFALAHASILSLRVRRPDLPRPFKLGLSIKIRGRELPVTALLGLLATTAVWIVILVVEPYSRWAGLAWMVVGFIVFFAYRRKRRLPLLHAEPQKKF